MIFLFYLLISTINCWSWTCDQNQNSCIRDNQMVNFAKNVYELQSENGSITYYKTIELCRLMCDLNAGLWPKPITPIVFYNKSLIEFSQIRILHTNDSFLQQVVNVFRRKFPKNNFYDETENILEIQLHIKDYTSSLSMNTNEGYNLLSNYYKSLNEIKVIIESETIFGARHGLETLYQLIETYHNNTQLVMLTNIEISDSPKFPYRGFMLDTSRHFIPKKLLLRQLDAMAASKLNSFHWHATDTQSFPLQFNVFPSMSIAGAYSETEIYTHSDIQEIIDYARIRGIRTIFEIDMPSHAGNGWQSFNSIEPLVVCLNEKFWREYCIQPPCGQLNPLNSRIQSILIHIFNEMIQLLGPDGLYHQGGDEVFIACWNKTIATAQNISFFQNIWSNFHRESYANYNKLNNFKNSPSILWSSELTRPDIIRNYINSSQFIIETWVPANDNLPLELIKLNYSVIMATKDAWYLDHGLWGNTKYHSWKNIYNNIVYEEVLGGETCMWTEYVDAYSLEPRVWPRAAAIAERLWTNPSSKSDTANNRNTLVRFLQHWHRLVHRSLINCEPIVPFWCYQNDNRC